MYPGTTHRRPSAEASSKACALTAGTFGIAAALTAASRSVAMPGRTLRVALLHLAPHPGDLAYNRRLVETAVITAASMRAAWILTPELCICGYAFADEIGTDWIVPPPDLWMRDLCQLVARLHVTVFLSYPERDPQTGKLYSNVASYAGGAPLTAGSSSHDGQFEVTPIPRPWLFALLVLSRYWRRLCPLCRLRSQRVRDLHVSLPSRNALQVDGDDATEVLANDTRLSIRVAGHIPLVHTLSDSLALWLTGFTLTQPGTLTPLLSADG